MCGIAGLVNRDGRPVDEDALRRMQALLSHRGPDDAGVYACQNVGLAHTRLSIIDVAGGHQPMCNEDGTVWIAYNGEVYNYKELRPPLEARGYVFRTNCDTEVILRLYEAYGTECLRYLNGMFAVAIWDQTRRRLFLARDRLGVKPLCYSAAGDAFVFASEPKAILASNAVARACNERRIPEYLAFRSIAGEETLFKGILNLLPGHSLTLEDGRLAIRQYWTIANGKVSETRGEAECLAELSALLTDAVRLRLRSDVPVGAFCSGGIDSSLVTALATEQRGAPLDTFSVGFSEREYDERRFARLVAGRYGTTHHELIVSGAAFADALPEAIWYNDEPLTHPNSVPLFLLSQYAKRHVTVVLTGEGADELLGGYPRYFIPLLALRYRALPALGRRVVAQGLRLWGSRRARKLRTALALPLDQVALHNSAFVDPEAVDSVWLKQAAGDRNVTWSHDGCSQEEFLRRFLLLEQQTYLVAILNRQDRMSMAAAVESRVPFLDYRLVEFCGRLPLRWKLKGFQNKYLLKRLADGVLPHDVVHRQKSGFGVPVAPWLRDRSGLGRYLELLREARFRQRGYFHQPHVDRLIGAHVAGTEGHGELLWALVNLELWHRLFLDSTVPSRCGAPSAVAEASRPRPSDRSAPC